MKLKDLRKFISAAPSQTSQTSWPQGFAAYIVEADMRLTPDRRIELQSHMSNWSYLSIFLQNNPDLLASEVAAMIYHEMDTKARPHIIDRLYSLWHRKMKFTQKSELDYFLED